MSLLMFEGAHQMSPFRLYIALASRHLDRAFSCLCPCRHRHRRHHRRRHDAFSPMELKTTNRLPLS